MIVRRTLALLLLMLTTSAAYRVTYDDDAVYSCLDTLAEIMTLAAIHSTAEIDGDDMVRGAIEGLLSQLDPHTSFYDRDRYKTMKEDQQGAFFGIGIFVGFQNDQLTVVSPLAGMPAAKAGIRAGDVIAEIDGKESESMFADDAIRLLRGAEGTHVKVKILRSGAPDDLFFTLTRVAIPSHNVETFFMADEQTGYVSLKEFGETATDEIKAALAQMTDCGMKQLILDLRGNPGGLLPQAVSVAGLFLPGKKLLVSTQGRLKSANSEYFSNEEGDYASLPLILLIDRGSASASEIVAGAIQDHDRGLILGISSWGKGLVQSVFPLSEGDSGLALTTSRYYTPSGRNIQGNYDSFEDYYNPKSSKELFFMPSEQKGTRFKTLHGRDVIQTRGITPDVYISRPIVSNLDLVLSGENNAYFNFAVYYQDQLPSFDADYEADDAVLEAFKSWLTKKEIATEGFDEQHEYLRQQLNFQILYTSSAQDSNIWALRYRIKHDHQMRTALKLFDQARELLAVYRGDAVLRPNLSEELKEYSRLQDSALLDQKAAISQSE